MTPRLQSPRVQLSVRRARRARERGMTLVEVLIAFAILAGVVSSVVALVGQNARFMTSAEDRLVAAIAADNLMTAELATRQAVQTGSTDGVIDIAGRRFVYTRRAIEASQRIFQIEFDVRREGETRTLARVSALKER